MLCPRSHTCNGKQKFDQQHNNQRSIYNADISFFDCFWNRQCYTFKAALTFHSIWQTTDVVKPAPSEKFSVVVFTICDMHGHKHLHTQTRKHAKSLNLYWSLGWVTWHTSLVGIQSESVSGKFVWFVCLLVGTSSCSIMELNVVALTDLINCHSKEEANQHSSAVTIFLASKRGFLICHITYTSNSITVQRGLFGVQIWHWNRLHTTSNRITVRRGLFGVQILIFK